MTSYLKNNVELIKRYENYYKKDFNIDVIKQNMIDGKLDIQLIDLFMFRIFLDSCVVLFNKEKIEKDYFKNSFNSKNYIANIKKKYKNIIEFVERQFNINVEDTFYYEFNELESKLNPEPLWNSRKILRNSYAHMQYGNFFSNVKGIIYCYGIFNKDNGVIKNKGIVIEALCHDFIAKFYLNQITKSVAYKHTYIETDNELKKCSFIEIRYKGDQKYSFGNELHPMNNKVFSCGDSTKRKEFLNKNVEEFNTKCTVLNEVDVKKYKDILREYLDRESTINELGYFIKSIYDIETEFSNFLAHLIQLNDRLIDYKIALDLEQRDYIDKIFASIDELKEDSESWIEFKWFFKVLYIINFSLKLEDSDLEAINYSEVCVEGLLYDAYKMKKFVEKITLDKKNQINEKCYGNVIYILSKIRNSIAHGKIKFEVCNEKIFFVFEDKYYRRNEQIKICIDDLDRFSESINVMIK